MISKRRNKPGDFSNMANPDSTREADRPRGLVRRTAAYFRPYWIRVVGITLLILVTAGLGVVNPLMIREVFDSALFPAVRRTTRPDLAVDSGRVMAGVTVVTGGLGIVQTYMTNVVGQRVMRDLRDRLYNHLQSLSLGFFTGARTGEIQSRIANDVGGVQNVVTNTVSNVLSNTVIVLSTLVAMTILSWQLTLVAVGIAPVFFLLTKVVGDRRRAVTAESQKAAADMTATTQETLSISGIMLAKLFGRQGQESGRFHSENQRLADLSVRLQMTGQFFFAVMQIFFSVSPVAIYLIAGYLLTGSALGESPPAPWSPSPRFSRGCSSRWAASCRCRWSSRPRWPCSSAYSVTWTSAPTLRTRPARSEWALGRCGAVSRSSLCAYHMGPSRTTVRQTSDGPWMA